MADPDWEPYFGFDEPYESQADAIESAIDVGKRQGYLAMEGPCGTGKTMAALTAAATLLREGDHYESVVVVTPVKQQLKQFVADLRTLNAGLQQPLAGISLVGKRDLCPYGREDVFPPEKSVHNRCEDLRENTAQLVESDGEGGDEPPAAESAVGGDPDEIWWDPQIASDLAKAARADATGQRALGGGLSTAGATSPYRQSQPTAPEDVAGDDPPLYCPFEADWYARNKGSPVDFAAGEEFVLTPDDYLPAATERGTCPHRAMGVLLANADVVIGNYNHLFDPDSRPLLAEILDERTFVIVDEAHRLEGRVRDLLSDRVGRQTLVQARNDCHQLLQRARQTDDHRAQVEARLTSHEVNLEAVEGARDFYDDVLRWLDERVERALDEEAGRGWRADPDTLPEHDIEVPLRDPETVETDELTEWATDEGYTGSLWRSLPKIGAAVEDTMDQLGIARQPVAAAVGAIMSRWWERDHATKLREIELEHSPTDDQRVEGWQREYTAGLVLFDCMPTEALREIFDALGGGMLMSATLSPLSVFTQVAGLNALTEGDPDGENPGRPIETRSYPLRFPESNRASWIVDASPFTARNRGEPTQDQRSWTNTRDEYAHVLRTVARSPGNVLIAMPNYREAAWAGSYLSEAVEKPVLVDESTSNDETEALKQRFFDGEGKVIVTSTRGTLTEGVDYDGAKLSTAAVVGVPLVNVGSPRVQAVRRAYGDAFGEDNAFEYALTVPAVRRARQAIGRVIRGTEEVGVRILADRRYVGGARHSVNGHLSPAEREEFVRMTPDFLAGKIEQFWSER
ncbi:ATP-dependent DNA helicase [Halapricum hydrolyticum]|uniref:ATP-dependent DNA helicase n=1 Tax=Halapricum hydrolyticum TaxID=2979991 RepID=A0AAE3IAX3_9EURY|nr:ATP-dependent DNA helicase [Halapricum hydrolyticum]MCU4718030.1 ATP-dependent DNA helicase [Halapricum hydrolyticum]MCU4727195.1 ATP-dependent DNA helicase [Halapricum hydrolyticum]